MRGYTQLTQEERYQIYILNKAEYSQTEIAELLERGTRRYHLHPDDLPVACRAPVRIITFLPGFDLDEEIAQARFGVPAEIIQVHAQQKHLLYPDKGLDLILNADGKEVLQYLPPDEFSAHHAQ
ncbi:MAG: hypothetical protein ABFS22_03330 [Pseudomonadota bacterium]